MNKNIIKLYEIAQKEEITVLGLMSGTSLDGLDLAVCKFRGSDVPVDYQLTHHSTVVYPSDLQQFIREVFSKKIIDQERFCLLNAVLGDWYAATILATLATWQLKPTDIDLIASHGQTVYHAPQHQHQQPHLPHATLQIGDADHIAYQTGILTWSDFRQKHTAAGGEGAPLAVYGDYYLFSSAVESRVLLNLGGIANFTYLPAKGTGNSLIVSDVGPANTLIDAAVRRYFSGKNFDEGGQIAANGKVNVPLLQALLGHHFFGKSFPKTTGIEVFNEAWLQEVQTKHQITTLEPQDLIATLTELTAQSVAEALQQLPEFETVFVSGGGALNHFLLARIQHHLPNAKIEIFDALGVPAEAKEAVLFAWLAYQNLKGQGNNASISIPFDISLGKLSFPG